jgi:predicted nuclease with TOPRIM domain
MSPKSIIDYAGLISAVAAALIIVRAAWQTNTAKVWKEEAEAQRARADRLQNDMNEIKERLTRIEAENARLIELLTALDPERINSLRR